MSSVVLSRLSILATCLWLLACSGASAPGGAAGSGGGPVGGGPSALGGSGAAAQPMDTGFSGPQKDIANIHYLIRDAKARVLCQAGEEKSKVRVEGFLLSQKPSGETYSAVGFLRIADVTLGNFLVTRTSMEEDQHGFFSTELKAAMPLNLSFDYKQNFEGPLDTLLPPEPSQDISIIIPVEAKPELAVETGPNASLPCIEKVFKFEVQRENGE